ncbi:MAG: AAA family ATPase, partial [Bacillota bacterium]|nr:AAA family ATPase [Bacillota bacterium]
MSTALVPRHYLTPDQLRAVELAPSEHRVVSGGPGSGKTQILLHRARYLVDTYQVPADRYRVFVYTRLLKDYIRSASQMLQLPENTITTLDSWCITAFKQFIGGTPPVIPGGIDFGRVREAVREYFGGKTPCFDFVLVDEGQDMPMGVYHLLRAVSRHITVCMDLKQQIYDFETTYVDVLRALGVRQQNAILLGHYRNCPYVVELAASFLDDAEERRMHLAQTHRPEGERSVPLLYVADS